MRVFRLLLSSFLLVLVAGCASEGAVRAGALDKAQYAWSAAIRWGDLDGAWALLGTDYRSRHVLTELERNRWKQVQVSSYRVLSSEPTGEDGSRREVEIGVVNRHTQTERQVRYLERWRWDAAAKTWRVDSGLPDLWAGR
ncbi:hypothetical protein EBB59_06450 [Lysobacter pythonis]|uniref:Lipoprotein n=1 Tax=Solilutibacter pythonis TaxID=2483112 RepID=A0A3M2I1V1_9GAMM|nr:hypothetical protein [Lysobacter pythonis]RMH93172.1 hypothetical protein EBB59_06450 [Lysobacter pythonis]